MLRTEVHKQHLWHKRHTEKTDKVVTYVIECKRCKVKKRVSFDSLTRSFLTCRYIDTNNNDTSRRPDCITIEETLF